MEDTAQNKYLYVVLSATPYKIGKFIRCVTGTTYNHASISLDPNLNVLYSFARYYENNPMYGGFCKESLRRFQCKSTDSKIMVCAIPLTEDKARLVSARLNYYIRNKDRYVYNIPSLAAAGFGRRIKIKNSYTCIEFVSHFLHSSGLYLQTQECPTFEKMEADLRKYAIYEGSSFGYSVAKSWGDDHFPIRLNVRRRFVNSAGTLRRIVKHYRRTRSMFALDSDNV